MMTKNELQMLNELISSFEFELELIEPVNIEKLYEMLHEADALYSDKAPRIAAYVELSGLYPGTIVRQARTVLKLLKQLYDHENISFVAGIMPITYENLSVCPKAQGAYKSGVDKYMSQCYQRNVLDDMRLSLELLVKQFLGNDKSLENQINNLGEELKLKGISVELRNLIDKVIDYLCKYHNH